MTDVRGSAVDATARFVAAKLGAPRVAEVYRQMTPEHREMLEAGVRGQSWYPLDLMLDLMRTAHAVHGGDAAQLYRDMGRASADEALTTIYRIFFKVGSPQFVVSKAASIFRTYYDGGHLRATVAEPGRAVLELHGFPQPARELCARVTGWIERTVELAGATRLTVTHDACVSLGAAACRFEARWS